MVKILKNVGLLRFSVVVMYIQKEIFDIDDKYLLCNSDIKAGILQYYPSEVLWTPFWKLWHYCWRKMNGYL